jgi:hypothetical protein
MCTLFRGGESMIETVADFLSEFIAEETKKLNEYELSHGPTIGAMYEGLTSDVLSRAIPRELGLQVANGFVTDESGLLSSQIDCMLVKGSGEKIPYTDSHKWHVKDVIAVFEVKKRLYSADIADSYSKLKTVLESHCRHVHSEEESKKEFDVSWPRRVFAQMTGFSFSDPSHFEALPFHVRMIYHTLIAEYFSPIRIMLGYDGFKSEFSFREAFCVYLNKAGGQGYGAASFPQLIVSGNYSCVKANGFPYTAPLEGDWWHFLPSTSASPIRLILELIWTRLTTEYPLGGLWGEDLELEEFHPFLKGRAVERGNEHGWECSRVYISRENLEIPAQVIKWEPTRVNLAQWCVFDQLCRGKEVRIDDPDLISFLRKEGHEVDEFLESLLATGMIAIANGKLDLTTEGCQCGILPDGDYIVAENNTGRLTRWLHNYMKSRKEKSADN